MKKPVSVKMLLLAIALTVTGVLSANAFPITDYSLAIQGTSLSQWSLHRLFASLKSGDEAGNFMPFLAGLLLVWVVGIRRSKGL